MLTVTEAACMRLNEMLSDHPDDVAARIVRSRGRMRLRRGSLQPGDDAVEYDGRTVLLVNDELAARLADGILDVHQTRTGPRLRLRRRPKPPAK